MLLLQQHVLAPPPASHCRQILHSHSGSFGLFLQHYLGRNSSEQTVQDKHCREKTPGSNPCAWQGPGASSSRLLASFSFFCSNCGGLKAIFLIATPSTFSSSRGMWLQLTEARKLPFNSIQNPPEKTRTSEVARIP